MEKNLVPQIPEIIGRAILHEEAIRKGIEIVAGMNSDQTESRAVPARANQANLKPAPAKGCEDNGSMIRELE